jgi:hypothetical protein
MKSKAFFTVFFRVNSGPKPLFGQLFSDCDGKSKKKTPLCGASLANLRHEVINTLILVVVSFGVINFLVALVFQLANSLPSLFMGQILI